jgi:membrane protein involved in colicin uptake
MTYQIRIYNIEGKLVQQSVFYGKQKKVDVGLLKEGMYFISVIDMESGELFKQKLFVF